MGGSGPHWGRPNPWHISLVRSRVVELRFFAGLDVSETAEALGVSENTVIREWAFARAWLQRALGGER